MMLTELMMVRAARAQTQFDMDRHAELQCAMGSWMQRIGVVSHRIIDRLRQV